MFTLYFRAFVTIRSAAFAVSLAIKRKPITSVTSQENIKILLGAKYVMKVCKQRQHYLKSFTYNGDREIAETLCKMYLLLTEKLGGTLQVMELMVKLDDGLINRANLCKSAEKQHHDFF